MSIKIKTTLIILSTFILGLMIGVLLTKNFEGSKKPHHLKKHQKERLSKMVFKVTEATDEQQKQLEPLLEKHHQEMKIYMNNFREEMDNNQKLFLDNLSTVLNDTQIDKLRMKLKKRIEGKRRAHKK